MTHICCSTCRLRFTPAAATHLATCPECGDSPQPIATAEELLGFRLFGSNDAADPSPQAIAVALTLSRSGQSQW